MVFMSLEVILFRKNTKNITWIRSIFSFVYLLPSSLLKAHIKQYLRLKKAQSNIILGLKYGFTALTLIIGKF